MGVLRAHEELIDVLEEISRELRGHVTEVLGEHGSSLSGMVLMQKIARDPGITVRELARRSEIVLSYVSKAIEELAQQGYLEKRPDPADKRLLRVYLTPGGQDLLRQLRQAMRSRLAAVVASVPEDTAATLVSGLQVMRDAIEGLKQGERRE